MIDYLEKLLGKSNFSDATDELKKYSVAGKLPSLVLFPASSDQVSEIMKVAKRNAKKILIAGNNSQHHFGSAIENPDWCISLNQMNKIIEHESADLIVTVEPGVTLPQLQRALGKHRQFLPLDPMGAISRTLGGLVATNSSGPLRLLYGTCRDLVLGMKVVLPDGTIIRIGGKTIKSVAGYDLSKLFIGSLGTLGTITEIAFKILPLPTQSQTVWAIFNRFNEIPDLIQSIGSSNLVISRCEYLNTTFVEQYLNNNYQLKGPHIMLFNVQGHRETVKATFKKLQLLLSEKGVGNIRCFSKEDDAKLWNQINSINSANRKSSFGFHCQISIPKSCFGKVISDIEKLSNDNILLSLAIQSHAGNGIIAIWGSNRSNEKIAPENYRSQIKSLRQIAQNHQGNMVVHQAPDALRKPELIWGKIGDNFPLMRAIKNRYDPYQVLVAGRFIGGL